MRYRTETMQKKLSLLIPKDLHHNLKKYALDSETTVTAILIDLIQSHLPSDRDDLMSSSN